MNNEMPRVEPVLDLTGDTTGGVLDLTQTPEVAAATVASEVGTEAALDLTGLDKPPVLEGVVLEGDALREEKRQHDNEKTRQDRLSETRAALNSIDGGPTLNDLWGK